MSKRSDNARREVLSRIVTRHINAWDPFELFAMGCPDNEYDLEIVQIANQIERFSSGEALSRLIAQVFRSMFSDARFTPEYCADVAEAIMTDARDQMR